jgi:hypothetical protein
LSTNIALQWGRSVYLPWAPGWSFPAEPMENLFVETLNQYRAQGAERIDKYINHLKRHHGQAYIVKLRTRLYSEFLKPRLGGCDFPCVFACHKPRLSTEKAQSTGS